MLQLLDHRDGERITKSKKEGSRDSRSTVFSSQKCIKIDSKEKSYDALAIQTSVQGAVGVGPLNVFEEPFVTLKRGPCGPFSMLENHSFPKCILLDLNPMGYGCLNLQPFLDQYSSISSSSWTNDPIE